RQLAVELARAARVQPQGRQAIRGREIEEVLSHGPEEPTSDRRAEALLASRQRRNRKPPRVLLPQEPLRRHALELPLPREPGRGLDDAVVEVRASRLEGHG